MTTKRIYFCANAWLSLIKKEEGRYQPIEQVILAAKKGECEIWTSTISVAEVYKSHAEAKAAVESDKMIDTLFEQGHVRMVAADLLITKDARTLLREHNGLKKPFDAIHLATALRYNCDELHTFDGENLLSLNGNVVRSDGVRLIIKIPTLEIGPLFDGADKNRKTA
jgi:predicted nucleic acid-binding protein